MTPFGDDGPPGGHGRNWAPAATVGDYLRNCAEGLEEFSKRRAAKLLGVSRQEIDRWILMAGIPDDLFETLLKTPGRRLSTRGFATIALAMSRGAVTPEIERCQHCGGVTRVRGIAARHLAIVNRWLGDGGAR